MQGFDFVFLFLLLWQILIRCIMISIKYGTIPKKLWRKHDQVVWNE